MKQNNYTVEATDTFQGTLGIRVSEGSDVVWAAYVFPILNPEIEEMDWAVDTYIGTQEVDYFVRDLNDGDFNVVKFREAILRWLGAPTFDLPVLTASLEKETFVA